MLPASSLGSERVWAQGDRWVPPLRTLVLQNDPKLPKALGFHGEAAAAILTPQSINMSPRYHGALTETRDTEVFPRVTRLTTRALREARPSPTPRGALLTTLPHTEDVTLVTAHQPPREHCPQTC